MDRFRLDLDGRAIHAGPATVSLTQKAFGLVALLTFRRLQERAGTSSGWVGLDEISLLEHWRGVRTTVSLRRQVRREIEGLEDAGLNAIQYRTKMNGPFRLALYPDGNVPDLDRLEQLAGAGRGIRPRALDDALNLSHDAEPLWRGMYFFDRRGTYLENSLESFQKATVHSIPLVRALAMLQAGRTLRELSRFQEAMTQLQACAAVANKEMPVEIRSFLNASVLLEMAWVEYRKRRFDEAENLITEATDYAYEAGQMRLLGDVMNMRALLYRRQRRFEDALQAHYTSLEYWLLSGHYYGIQSFYHNLACWCLDSAKNLPAEDDDGKQALIQSAIRCADTSVGICKQYDIGHNTRLSEILLADLHAECGDFKKAMDSASAAWEGAESTGSRYEMAMAAYKILKLRLWRRQYEEAESFMNEYRSDKGNEQFLSLIEAAFALMLKQARSGQREMPSASGLLGTLS